VARPDPERRRLRRLDARLLTVGVVLVLAWVAIGYRLVVVQALDSEQFAARGLDQRLHREALAADRGTIFDRDGRELAITVDSVSIYANPSDIEDPGAVARLLAPLVDESPGTLMQRLGTDDTFVYVARQMDPDDAELVLAAQLPGIFAHGEPARLYPVGELTSHVIGFVSEGEGTGLEGLELQYDAELRGTPGELQVERDPQGRTIPQGTYRVVPAEPGSDLVLTLKTEIQFAAHRALQAAVERTGADSGSVVVLDARNGEILAMVNLPAFDPHEPGRAPEGALRNRSVTDIFEPGSTQKAITVAGVLESGLVGPTTVLDLPQLIEIQDTTFLDLTIHPDRLTVTEIVTYSSNIGTILLGDMLGTEALHGYMAAFGEGRATGVDFPGEASGVLRAPEDWCPTTCLAGTSIGYHVAVTPLQMAAVFATVANDGEWVQPHLVKELVDGRGVRAPVTVRREQVISPGTASSLRLMLEAVVETGTGSLAAVPGYRVGGKTGTTEKYDAVVGDYTDDQVVASFIGIAPIESPRIVVAVVLDSPINDASGGSGAAPVFAEVALAALHQLGVPPDAE
jgi:cell division protein FtsI (penicillin-binding protein 3)